MQTVYKCIFSDTYIHTCVLYMHCISNVWCTTSLFWGVCLMKTSAFRWICAAKVLAQHEEHMNLWGWSVSMDWGKQEREHGISVFHVFSQDLCEKNRFDDLWRYFVWTKCSKFKRCHCSTVWCDVCKAGHLLGKGIPPWARRSINSDTSVQDSALNHVGSYWCTMFKFHYVPSHTCHFEFECHVYGNVPLTISV